MHVAALLRPETHTHTHTTISFPLLQFPLPASFRNLNITPGGNLQVNSSVQAEVGSVLKQPSGVLSADPWTHTPVFHEREVHQVISFLFHTQLTHTHSGVQLRVSAAA